MGLFGSKLQIGRTLAFLCALVLLIAALGFYPHYSTLKVWVFVFFCGLTAVAYVQHYNLFSGAFLLAALLFNPFVPAWLPRNMWIIIDVILIAGLGMYVFWSTNPYQKGTRFEKFVSSLYPDSRYVILDRTRDNGKYLGRYVATDKNPDFLLRDKSTGEEFAVECKWRNTWFKLAGYPETGIQWSVDWTRRYEEYGKNKSIRVLLVLGVGGAPEAPREVYRLPIGLMKWNFIKKSYIVSNSEVLVQP